jgi:hypothetical protein
MSSESPAVTARKPTRRPLELLLPLAAVAGAGVTVVGLTAAKLVFEAMSRMGERSDNPWPSRFAEERLSAGGSGR